MENQHRKITGYRELTDDEIRDINHCKDLSNLCGELIAALEDQIGTDKRAVSIAKTKLQEGFMWAIRSIAKPEGF